MGPVLSQSLLIPKFNVRLLSDVQDHRLDQAYTVRSKTSFYKGPLGSANFIEVYGIEH